MTEYEEICIGKSLLELIAEREYQIKVLGYNKGDSFPSYLTFLINKKMQTTQEVFDACRIEGNNVYLPQQLDRALYQQVNKALVGIGGKWNRSAKAHVFPTDPSELLGRVQNGEKINLKKEFQFFETPDEIADWLVELADILPWSTVLEPSAGQGAIIDAIHRRHGNREIFAIELMGTNTEILKEKYQHKDVVIKREFDFLEWSGSKFDRIIANPPFTKNQDIDHIQHMYDRLENNGRLVSVASEHWEISNNQKESDFRYWLQSVGAHIMDIERGSFKSSGTLVGAKVIVIDKNV